eukprot:1736339-Prymnesium_polylepis.1
MANARSIVALLTLIAAVGDASHAKTGESDTDDAPKANRLKINPPCPGGPADPSPTLPTTPCNRSDLAFLSMCSLHAAVEPIRSGSISSSSRLYATRQEGIAKHAAHGSNVRAVEIGVQYGLFAQFLLQELSPKELVQLDITEWATKICNTKTTASGKRVVSRSWL